MSASCPELRAESVPSSDSEGDCDAGNAAARSEVPPAESHDGGEAAPSTDDGALPTTDDGMPPAAEPAAAADEPDGVDRTGRRRLQWEFKGLTLFLELEEFDGDITAAVEDLSRRRSSPWIPRPHATAIYGMEHLAAAEAAARLRGVPRALPGGAWPPFAPPTGIVCDVAVCGRPGQVCDVAWSELTLATGPRHEAALDALHGLFRGDLPGAPDRERPWKPHCSVAYDNPETNALSLLDTAVYASAHPTLLGRGRRVEAISLWSTVGKMEEWFCLERVKFF